jgi:hypothetical protein
MAQARKTPWQRTNPRKRAGKASKKLSPAQKATAKTRAKRAGRRYPNLVDNMYVASKTTRKKSTQSKTGKSTATRKTATTKSSSRKAGAKRRSNETLPTWHTRPAGLSDRPR